MRKVRYETVLRAMQKLAAQGHNPVFLELSSDGSGTLEAGGTEVSFSDTEGLISLIDRLMVPDDNDTVDITIHVDDLRKAVADGNITPFYVAAKAALDVWEPMDWDGNDDTV